MPVFRTQYDQHERVRQEPGSRVKILYGPEIDEHGHLELVVTGKEDLYGYIQSHAESVDIHVILDRFARGDVDVLSRFQGVYGDFTTVPTSYAELLNTVIKGEQYFDQLPVEVKEQFGHNFNNWLINAGSPDWMSKMGYSSETPSVPPSDAGSSSVSPSPSPSSGGTPPASTNPPTPT